MKIVNPYAVLGVHRKSTDEEIRAAYYARARKHHPDVAGEYGEVDQFMRYSQAYRLIVSKEARRVWDEDYAYRFPKCDECHGTGFKSKSKGFSYKEYKACTSCHGAGVIIKQQEEENVTIELHGAAGTGGARSNNKRKPRTDKRS